MVSGFLVQQATRIPLIESLIAGDAAEAKRGFDGLLAKSAVQGRSIGFGGDLDGCPLISSGDPGFASLAALYSALISTGAKSGNPVG